MISTADLQEWMKADDADAPVLRRLEEAAVQAVQRITGRYYGVTAAITDIIRFKGWPLELANEPIGGVLTSLAQWDGSAWAAEDLANYYADGSFVWPNSTFSSPVPWLVPASSQRYRAIYQAGYTADPLDADVWPAPADVQQAVRLLVGYWMENREAEGEVPQHIKDLLSSRTRVAV